MYRKKRLAALAAAAAMLLSLGSCASKDKTVAVQADASPVFMLSSLPDIGKYEPAQNYKRYSDSYCGELVPGNYGTLIPFVGRDSEFSLPEDPDISIRESLYGLMTADGTVAVDPVYTAFETYDTGDGNTVLALTSVPGDSSDPNNYHNLLTVTPSDGSWVINRIDAYLVSATDGRIVINACSDQSDYSLVETFNCVEVFDLKGKEVAKYDYALSDYGYKEGILYLQKENPGIDEYYEYTTLLIDDSGKTVLESSDICSPFKNGIAVCREGDYFGLIRRDGTWLLDPIYENVETVGTNTEFYHASVSGSGLLLDSNGNAVSKYEGEGYGRNYFVVNGRPVFSRILDDEEQFYNANGKPITCKQSGAVATTCNDHLGYFFGAKDGVGYVFDIDGNLLASLDGATGMDPLSSSDYSNYYVLYIASGEDSTGIVFSSETHKEVYRFTVNENDSSAFIESITPEGIAVIWQSNDTDVAYRVVDLATGKVLVESCPFAIIVRADGKAYVNVCFDNVINVYDGSYGLLLKVTNIYTD